MYGNSFNRNVDSKVIVELDDGRRFRVHQTGYVEGDTNGFVEGDYEIFPIEGDDWYEELSDEEGLKFFDPLYNKEPEFMTALLFGRKGKKAFNCYIMSNSRKKAFRFKKKFWRVYKIEHIERDESGFLSVGYCNNYKAIYHLVSFGAITLFEAIQDASELKEWEDCDCQSSRFEDY